jgi:chromosome segregation ATPase
MDLQDIEKYRERLENEYLELLSYREGILKQTEIEEKKLKELQDSKEYVIREVTAEIVIANNTLEGIRKERESYYNNYVDKDQAITMSLMNIEDREQQLKREVDEFSRTKESYKETMDFLAIEKMKLKEEKAQMEIEKRIIKRMEEMEEHRLEDLKEAKLMLERKKGYENKLIKGLKIQGLKLDQRSEAVKKTKDFLINKEESLNNKSLHIESQIKQLRSALNELKKREAKLNG